MLTDTLHTENTDEKAQADWARRCTYYPPKTYTQRGNHESVSDLIKGMGGLIIDICPKSRERSFALIKLEEARMWANAALAIHANAASTEEPAEEGTVPAK